MVQVLAKIDQTVFPGYKRHSSWSCSPRRELQNVPGLEKYICCAPAFGYAMGDADAMDAPRLQLKDAMILGHVPEAIGAVYR